jgi:hypothetical protein
MELTPLEQNILKVLGVTVEQYKRDLAENDEKSVVKTDLDHLGGTIVNVLIDSNNLGSTIVDLLIKQTELEQRIATLEGERINA